ncbi:hypothetical protein A8U91_02912 [Halomonas elongata]|uniref:Uncharacterized protein n=1 Tax=Halomonas elongata TaxID=2746 RepID=A0A1B8NV30_HALEL|nr:hypothetical protein [Halomonas elongata]OBX33869.1 hypothetical protein A8U91_02912 [Halomonas elongata]
MTTAEDASRPLPSVLAGPLLRRLSSERLLFWLVGSRPLDMQLVLQPDGQPPRRLALNDKRVHCLPLGRHAYLHLIDVSLGTPLPQDVRIDYDLRLPDEGGIADWAPPAP